MSRSFRESNALAADLEASGDLTSLNRLLFEQMWRRLIWGDPTDGVAVCDRGIELVGRLGLPPVQYPTLRAANLLALGRYREVWASLQQEVADEEHPFGLAFRQLGEGVYYFELGAHERAATTLRRVVEQANQLSRPWMRQAAECVLAVAETRLGRIDRAWALARWDVLETYWSISQTTLPTAELLLAQGDAEGALAQLDELEVQARELELWLRLAAIAEARSRVLLQLGRPAEANAATDDALEFVQERGLVPLGWRLHAARAAALTALDRPGEAAAEWASAATIVRQLASSIPDDELRAGYLTCPDVAAVLAAND
jgi:tetratricopeptide (TPR) repeat protein